MPLMPASPSGESEFVSEAITPERGTFKAGPLASGLASLPEAFRWRGARLAVKRVLSEVKVSRPERFHEGHERYLKRQEFVLEFEDGSVGTIYFERHARPGTRPTQRWFLYEIRRPNVESKDH